MEVTLQSFKKRFTYDQQKDLLGKGGFGEVYKAYDNEDQLFVALKIAQGITDDKYNLINEIKRFKKLNHPNIVKHIEAYEVNTGGTDIHGNPIIHHVGILEYADQGTFADLLKKGTNYRQIEDLAKDIIDGLAYLHSEGIIHRDLKPTNILLFSEGEKLRAKITDFGIAKRADATAASTQLVGTVEYMAPEYFTTGNITPASDVWSVGVMLLEALTGSHPFGKTTQGLNNQQIINQILNKDISSAIQPLNAPFKDMITRCLLRDTNLRPQSANELKGLLQESGDTFSEETKVIDLKKKVAVKESKKGKLKRWGKELFNFDMRNGKWRKVLAREFLLILLCIPVILALRFVEYYDDMKHLLGKDLEYKTESLYSELYNINMNVAEESGNWEWVKPDSLFLHRKEGGDLEFISKQDFFKNVNSDEKRMRIFDNLAEFYAKGKSIFGNYKQFRKVYGEYKFDDLFNEYVDEIKSWNFDKQLTNVFFIIFGFRYFFSLILWAIKTLWN